MYKRTTISSVVDGGAEQRRMRHTIGAVVITHNDGHRILNTVASLIASRFPLESITVMDNGSTDGSAERIAERFACVRVVRLPENLGLPAARNAGIAQATSDRLLLIDGDVLLEAEAITRLDRAMTETGASVVCPRVRLHPQRQIVQADGAEAHFLGTMRLRFGYRPIASLDARRAEVGGCIGACMLVDKVALDDVGGFDDLYFFYFEDLEFMLRLRGRGYRFVCEPSAVVYHDRGTGTMGLSFRGNAGQAYPLRRVYYVTRHRWLSMLTHYRLRTLLLLSPALMLYELASLVLIVKRGWLATWLRAIGWLLAHHREVLQRRRVVQRMRTVPDGEMLDGGPVPLAPGLVRSKLGAGLIRTLSAVLNGYWRLIRPMVC